MESPLSAYIETLHSSVSAGLSLVSAGGAAGAGAGLVAVPGGSRLVLEIAVPYSEAAQRAYCPGLRGGAVRAERAAALADRAFERAARWTPPDREPVGAACTAALATDRIRRGDEQAFLCIRRADRRIACHVPFTKGESSRAGQEERLNRMLLNLIGSALDAPPAPWADEVPAPAVTALDDPFAAVAADRAGWALVHRDGQWVKEGETAPVLLPGSFNPFHVGHDRLARAASLLARAPVDLELSMVNADKPPLARHELDRRLAAIQGSYRVVVSREPTFLGKARLLPGRTFVVGYDTAVRLIDPSYYDGSTSRRDAALEEIRELGSRFIVAGRLDGDRFHTLSDLPLPAADEDLFEPLPPDQFREDIAATDIRTR